MLKTAKPAKKVKKNLQSTKKRPGIHIQSNQKKTKFLRNNRSKKTRTFLYGLGLIITQIKNHQPVVWERV